MRFPRPTRWPALLGLLITAAAACTTARKESAEPAAATSPGKTLADARKGFATKTRDTAPPEGPPDKPPPGLFSLVHYPSPVGPLAAYVSPRPNDGKRHPAIVWIIGGFSNSIGGTAWEPADRDNDQSARAFREAGIVLMLPSLRGGNDNPGKRESFYGEVDDVIAARDYVSKLDYVEPARVYLGGHSTGGTMALLVAESTEHFRTIFAFGPVDNIAGYGDELVFDANDEHEVRLRSPMFFTSAIRTPTWVIEGASPPSNAAAIPWLTKAAGAAPIHAFTVRGATHFSILAPVTSLLAKKILEDTGPAASIALTAGELAQAVGSP